MSVVGHNHIDDFGDAPGFVGRSVYVIDRDRFRKLPGREFACSYDVSVWKSGLRTGKRPGLDRTGPEKDRTAVLVFDI